MNNTDVDKIKTQVYGLINDFAFLDIEHLQHKYEYLYKTSKTLFDFTIREHKSKNFNKFRFENNLEFMLTRIVKIQNNELTQNDASENVGELVAKQFIPQLQ